jgi:hypothetical protein
MRWLCLNAIAVITLQGLWLLRFASMCRAGLAVWAASQQLKQIRSMLAPPQQAPTQSSILYVAHLPLPSLSNMPKPFTMNGSSFAGSLV